MIESEHTSQAGVKPNQTMDILLAELHQQRVKRAADKQKAIKDEHLNKDKTDNKHKKVKKDNKEKKRTRDQVQAQAQQSAALTSVPRKRLVVKFEHEHEHEHDTPRRIASQDSVVDLTFDDDEQVQMPVPAPQVPEMPAPAPEMPEMPNQNKARRTAHQSAPVTQEASNMTEAEVREMDMDVDEMYHSLEPSVRYFKWKDFSNQASNGDDNVFRSPKDATQGFSIIDADLIYQQDLQASSSVFKHVQNLELDSYHGSFLTPAAKQARAWVQHVVEAFEQKAYQPLFLTEATPQQRAIHFIMHFQRGNSRTSSSGGSGSSSSGGSSSSSSSNLNSMTLRRRCMELSDEALQSARRWVRENMHRTAMECFRSSYGMEEQECQTCDWTNIICMNTEALFNKSVFHTLTARSHAKRTCQAIRNTTQ